MKIEEILKDLTAAKCALDIMAKDSSMGKTELIIGIMTVSHIINNTIEDIIKNEKDL